MLISNTCVFLQRSICHRTAAASFSVAMVWATPYMPFLKVPWANKQLVSYNFAYRTRKKATGVKSSK
jgi:hypothetical protein